MRVMMRRSFVWSVLLLLASVTVGSQERLRITPFVNDNRVVVSFELNDAYNDAVREAIASGLRTTFTYEIELRMVVPIWVDRTIATSVVSTSDQYDNLTRRHRLSRTIDGKVENAAVTEDEGVVRTWLTTFSRLPLAQTAKLDPNRDYYVTVRADVRPRGTSLLGWANGITGQAKFTFVP